MRPTEFSNEEIVKAGLELQAAGRSITGFALRKQVGGGSPSRLRQVWSEYANSQAMAQAEPVAELPMEVAEQLGILSTTLIERLKTLAADLNDRAVKASERRVSEVLRTAGEQRAQAERELADASLTVDDLEANLNAAAADRELLRTKLDESNTASQSQAIEIAKLRERLSAAEIALSKTKEQLKAEVEKASQAREEAARYAGHVDVLERHNAELTEKLQQNVTK